MFDQLPVSELPLSVRSANCLRNDNIVTVGDLITRSAAELLRTPNFGRKSLWEVQTFLGAMGLHLVDDFPLVTREEARRRIVAMRPPSDQTGAKARRNRKIVEMRQSGQTLKAVGEAFGVSRERVRQLVRRSTVDRPSLRRFLKLTDHPVDVDAILAAAALRNEARKREWQAAIVAEREQMAAQRQRWEREAAERSERRRKLHEHWPCPGCGRSARMGDDIPLDHNSFPIWLVCTKCGHLQIVTDDLTRHEPDERERRQAMEWQPLREYLESINAAVAVETA